MSVARYAWQMGLKTIPQLPSSDFDETARFYENLGFTERNRWPGEYLILQRPADDLELHFWFAANIDPKTNYSSCYVRFDEAREARALHEEWKALGISSEHLRSLQETDYGLLEFALVDPHANLIRIGGAIEPS